MTRDTTICMGCGQVKGAVSGEDITDQGVRILKMQLTALERRMKLKEESNRPGYDPELSKEAIDLAKAIAHLSRERRGVLKDKTERRKNMTHKERQDAMVAYWKSLPQSQRIKLFEGMFQNIPAVEQAAIAKTVLGMRNEQGPTGMFG